MGRSTVSRIGAFVSQPAPIHALPDMCLPVNISVQLMQSQTVPLDTVRMEQQPIIMSGFGAANVRRASLTEFLDF